MIENKLLDGSVTHVNIPKGTEHYSVMYIAPRALEKLTGGKPFTAASIGKMSGSPFRVKARSSIARNPRRPISRPPFPIFRIWPALC